MEEILLKRMTFTLYRVNHLGLVGLIIPAIPLWGIKKDHSFALNVYQVIIKSIVLKEMQLRAVVAAIT